MQQIDLFTGKGTPLDDGRANSRAIERGFLAAPRLLDCMNGAEKVAEVFMSKKSEIIVKDLQRGFIRRVASHCDVFDGLGSGKALGRGCATAPTPFVRKLVKAMRVQIKKAQEAGDLNSATFKVKEMTRDSQAVCIVESAVFRFQSGKREFDEFVIKPLIRDGWDDEIIRCITPAPLTPAEWLDLVEEKGDQKALEIAFRISEEKLHRAFRAGERKRIRKNRS